jgi:acetyltransferase-like isoleucine patch superfamily enzyme
MTYGGFIRIGDHCSVNPFCVLYGHGGLTIGNNVRIATCTVIIPANHVFSDLDIPIHKQGTTALGIVIEDNVWIGANVTILDGVRIGRGAVIGAGAVVTKDVDPLHVVGGVPACTIKVRR